MTDGGIYLYVSQHRAHQISVLRLSPETGELTPVQDLAVGGEVMPMAVSPDRRFLYAAMRNKPDVQGLVANAGWVIGALQLNILLACLPTHIATFRFLTW